MKIVKAFMDRWLCHIVLHDKVDKPHGHTLFEYCWGWYECYNDKYCMEMTFDKMIYDFFMCIYFVFSHQCSKRDCFNIWDVARCADVISIWNNKKILTSVF